MTDFIERVVGLVSFGVIEAVILLLLLAILVTRELISGLEGEVTVRAERALKLAVIPLVAGFIMIAVIRIILVQR